MSLVKEVPGSSPGWGDILFIFTLSPLGTKSQKCKTTEHPTKIGVSNYSKDVRPSFRPPHEGHDTNDARAMMEM